METWDQCPACYATGSDDKKGHNVWYCKKCEEHRCRNSGMSAGGLLGDVPVCSSCNTRLKKLGKFVPSR